MSYNHIEYIVIHCSATNETMDIGAAEIRDWHVNTNGWSDIGYHYVIRRSGAIEPGRRLELHGAHVYGYNRVSWGICMVGGVSESGKPVDNFTPQQKEALMKLLVGLNALVPQSKIVGHRDLSPDVDGDGIVERHEWLKDCPCFEVSEFLEELGL